jgi:hypothetical protein
MASNGFSLTTSYALDVGRFMSPDWAGRRKLYLTPSSQLPKASTFMDTKATIHLAVGTKTDIVIGVIGS